MASELVDALEEVLNRHELQATSKAAPQREKPRPKPPTRQLTAEPPDHRPRRWGRWAAAVVTAGAFAAWWFLWPNGNAPTPAPPPADVPVGTAPHAIAIDRAHRFALVAENGSDAVGVVDLAGRTVVASIPVGNEPEAVALSADDSTAYVPNHGTNTLSVIDVPKRSVVASIPVGSGPVDVALTRDGRRAYVSNAGAGSVSIVDTATRAVIGEIKVAPIWGDTLGGIAVSPDGSRVLVSATRYWFEDRVFEIDTAKGDVAGGIRAGEAPQDIAFSQDGRHAYVANSGSDTVSVVDVANRTETTAIPVSEEPQKLALSADGGTVYVMSPRSDSITVIDLTTNAVTKRLSIDGGPIDLAPTGGSDAYVVKRDSGHLTAHSLAG